MRRKSLLPLGHGYTSGLKLEQFIFDAFHYAPTTSLFEVPREEEFAPVKNGNGSNFDTPDSARLLVLRLHSRWVVATGGFFDALCATEVLLRLLLESTFLVTSLLDSKDEAFLQKVLYDVVILVEYSFLNIESEMMLTSNCVKRVAVRKLIVVHEATEDARGKGDHTKAISYINAFSRSSLPSELVKWATSQIGMDGEIHKPNVTTPQALLQWLLNLENQGVRVFDNNALKLRAKLVLDESKAGYEHRVLQPNSKVGDDLFFYIDNKREGEEEKADDEEMVDSMDAAFKAAARTMKFTANDETRKRKEARKGGEKSKVKFLKYHLHDNSVKANVLPPKAHDDDTKSDSWDEDMEE